MASSTLYQVLGVGQDADYATIRKAYKDLALTYHPDKAGHGSTARMQTIQAAWETLSDSSKRSAYDRTLKSSAPRTTQRKPRKTRTTRKGPCGPTPPSDDRKEDEVPHTSDEADPDAEYKEAKPKKKGTNSRRPKNDKFNEEKEQKQHEEDEKRQRRDRQNAERESRHSNYKKRKGQPEDEPDTKRHQSQHSQEQEPKHEDADPFAKMREAYVKEEALRQEQERLAAMEEQRGKDSAANIRIHNAQATYETEKEAFERAREKFDAARAAYEKAQDRYAFDQYVSGSFWGAQGTGM